MSRRMPRNSRGRASPPAIAGLRRRNPDAVEHAIGALATMNLDQLRAEWQTRLARPAPSCRSKEVIRGLLAWHIQAEVWGGLSPRTTQRLRRIAERDGRGDRRGKYKRRSSLKPGTVLTREWRGRLHKVHVLEAGFAHEGRTYSSLSEIARAITGTRWSGPRFFGLAGDASASEIQP